MKSFYQSILLLAGILFGVAAMAQTNEPKTLVTPEIWQQMKAAGTITKNVSMHDPNAQQQAGITPPVYIDPHPNKVKDNPSPCNCMQPVFPITGPDSTGFHVCPIGQPTPILPWCGNDDGSTAQITIPFQFCFYGGSYNQIYINNNGNISFGSAYGTFSPVGLQNAAEKMVAPFWSDVMTSLSNNNANNPTTGYQIALGGAGAVFYKITPHAVIVRWDSVGYFANHTDKITDYQCIITDGSDPLVQGGNNVKFCYGVMQWTTGDASGDSAGFCGLNGQGSPAAVGATNADGTNYIQFGLFGRPGNFFTNPNSTYPYDGVSWLDNQTFQFSTCSGNNIPPVAVGLQYCDTLRMCLGDTLQIPVQFQSPEANQITHDSAYSTMDGFSIIYDTVGNVASIMVQVVADSLDVGNNTVTFVATDNGNPVGITIITIDIKVDSANAPKPVINPINPTTCANFVDSIWVVSDTSYTFFQWNTGATSDTIFGGPGIYSVTVTSPNGCRAHTTDTIGVYPGSIPVISGAHQHCPGDSSVLSVQNGFSTFSWSTGASTPTITVDVGTFTVTVQDSNGCIGTSLPFTVTSSSEIPALTGTPHVCGTDTSQLAVTPANFANYQWSNGMSTPVIWVHGGTFYVTVTDTAGCTNVDSFKVRQTANPIPQINGNTVYCGTDSVTLTTSPNGMASYFWSDGNGNQTGIFGGGTYHVTVTDTSGCVGTDSITVIQHPRPTPAIGGNPAFCAYDSTTLNIDSTYVTYLWSNGATTQSIITNLDTTYYVTVTNQFGCTGTSIGFNTIVYPVPQAAFNIVTPLTGRPDTIINFYDVSTVLGGIIDSSWWSFGDGDYSTDFNTIHIYQTDGLYTIELITTTDKGCKDTIYDYYIINSVPVIPPNVFTPNSDGKNDYLVYLNLWEYAYSRLEIFNRWGLKLYDNPDYKNDWTGDNHPDGVYFYILHVADQKGTIMKGTIEIIRNK